MLSELVHIRSRITAMITLQSSRHLQRLSQAKVLWCVVREGGRGEGGGERPQDLSREYSCCSRLKFALPPLPGGERTRGVRKMAAHRLIKSVGLPSRLALLASLILMFAAVVAEGAPSEEERYRLDISCCLAAFHSCCHQKNPLLLIHSTFSWHASNCQATPRDYTGRHRLVGIILSVTSPLAVAGSTVLSLARSCRTACAWDRTMSTTRRRSSRRMVARKLMRSSARARRWAAQRTASAGARGTIIRVSKPSCAHTEM